MVTSGYEKSTGNETEILNLDTMTWRAGPQFPALGATERGTSLPYKNSFLVIGGHTDTFQYSYEIWYFNPDRYSWEVISYMYFGREYATAIALPESTHHFDQDLHILGK